MLSLKTDCQNYPFKMCLSSCIAHLFRSFFLSRNGFVEWPLVLALALLFILLSFLTPSVFSFFPSPSFHPPVRFPPSLFLISSRCVSCIPVVRGEGEGSRNRRGKQGQMKKRGREREMEKHMN